MLACVVTTDPPTPPPALSPPPVFLGGMGGWGGGAGGGGGGGGGGRVGGGGGEGRVEGGGGGGGIDGPRKGLMTCLQCGEALMRSYDEAPSKGSSDARVRVGGCSLPEKPGRKRSPFERLPSLKHGGLPFQQAQNCQGLSLILHPYSSTSFLPPCDVEET